MGLTIGIFLLVFIFAAAIIYFVQGAQEKAKQKRLQMIVGDGGDGKGNAGADALQERRKEDLSKKLKEINEAEKQNQKKKKTPLSLLLQQAGWEISTRTFFFRSLIFGFVFTIFMFLFGAPAVVVWVSPIIGTFGLSKVYLKRAIAKRQRAFLGDLADALEAMIRLLKAGMPVSECIYMVSEEFQSPVGEEMRIIYEAQKIGVPLQDAVKEAADRMPLPEMRMFATGVAIQVQTGSSLSEVLQNLANVIRSRFRLKRKVKSLSSEAKTSAMIIGALPFLVAFGLYAVNPDYMSILWSTSQGKTLMIGAGFWMSIGVFMMRQMINFKV